MGSLNGTFYGAGAEGAVYLTVQDSNDATGQFSGMITQNGIYYNANGSYHFANGVGPNAAIQVITSIGAPGEIWILSTPDLSFSRLTGSRSRMQPDGTNISGSMELAKIA